MERRRPSSDPRHHVPYHMVLEMFWFICNRLGLEPQFENPRIDMKDEENEALIAIGETILAVQILLRNFFKSLFTRRSRAIFEDLRTEAVDMCNTVVEQWTDGADIHKVYVVSALLMELFLYCFSLQIDVEDNLFPQIWYDRLSELFGHTVILRGGQLPLGDPNATEYYHTYPLLAGYIFNLQNPYQSVPLRHIEAIQPSFNFLNTAMRNVFNDHEFTNIQTLGFLSLRNIYGHRSEDPLSSRQGGSSSAEAGGSRREDIPSTSYSATVVVLSGTEDPSVSESDTSTVSTEESKEN